MRQRASTNSALRIVSANVRGFHTNVGELTHRFVRTNKPDLVFVTETFLDDNIPSTYARIQGYSTWIRKDRSTQENIDHLMTVHQCDNVLILGDLNPPGKKNAFESLLTVFDLQYHVTFPTHRSGSSLDPVITDFTSHEVTCSALGPVGTSDHEAILTRISFKRPQEVCVTRTLWQWEDADWEGLRRHLAHMDWDRLLQGDVDRQVELLTEALMGAQGRWVPNKQHTTLASDQPWFGPQCRAASDERFQAWRTYKRHPSWRNWQRHREEAAYMEDVQAWARVQWVEDMKRKLKGGNIGSKQWW
ncbi:hypothetical protein E2C01_060859 [Portunus trituberculatus]|uniref:Endonuclease/exonuclease/phosphatase domain-containing protein n=1 Tax=Portunus trituberculatus TaxID=210409 RepID=A0A5B7HBQ0_PORTR|nr:hypothetical protein [Portunus trituberculatus]